MSLFEVGLKGYEAFFGPVYGNSECTVGNPPQRLHELTFRGGGSMGSPYAYASLGVSLLPGTCGYEFYLRSAIPWHGLINLVFQGLPANLKLPAFISLKQPLVWTNFPYLYVPDLESGAIAIVPGPKAEQPLRMGVGASGKLGEFFMQEEYPGTVYALPVIPITRAEYEVMSPDPPPKMSELLCKPDFDPLRACLVDPVASERRQDRLRREALPNLAASLLNRRRRLARLEELGAPEVICQNERDEIHVTDKMLQALRWDGEITAEIERLARELQERIRQASEAEGD